MAQYTTYLQDVSFYNTEGTEHCLYTWNGWCHPNN